MTLPAIVELNVLVPEIAWLPEVITPPAASTLVASVTSADASIPLNLVLSAPVMIAPEPALVISDSAVTLLVVYRPFVTVPAFPVTLPAIVELNVFVPAIVWLPDVITPPAASTLVASVTSAAVSIPLNFVLSAPVMIAPEPAFVTSLRAVTLLVVYTPFVTVPAFPVILPAIAELNVLVPEIVWLPVTITPPAAATLVASVTSAAVSMPFNLVLSASVIMAPEPA